MRSAFFLCLLALLLGLVSSAEPGRAPDRHAEFTDPAQDIDVVMPDWPGYYPEPAQARVAGERFYIVIHNEAGGSLEVVPEMRLDEMNMHLEIGQVLAPVSNINRKGFTASGWAAPGTVCASAVNAMHIKTDHNYADGRGVIFSLVPIEFATFDPQEYKSYFNQSSTLFTDIKGGHEIFGGQWAPLVGSEVQIYDEELRFQEQVETTYSAEDVDYYTLTRICRIPPGYLPQVGDMLLIPVLRREYNPEYIEFENGYGGLIWIKEVGLERYPIGQVLKPVAGVGRFLGTQYAEVGRIRAAHPGVIDISTSPYDVIGGFQIIPRDHAMSPEMGYTRIKTQWMVVGPLWALDPSWEGLPPLFTDYLYPAFTPAFNDDGTVNTEVDGAEVFLDRFTIRARYSDAPDPEAWELMHKEIYLDHDALKNMTHLRVYFPRG